MAYPVYIVYSFGECLVALYIYWFFVRRTVGICFQTLVAHVHMFAPSGIVYDVHELPVFVTYSGP